MLSQGSEPILTGRVDGPAVQPALVARPCRSPVHAELLGQLQNQAVRLVSGADEQRSGRQSSSAKGRQSKGGWTCYAYTGQAWLLVPACVLLLSLYASCTASIRQLTPHPAFQPTASAHHRPPHLSPLLLRQPHKRPPLVLVNIGAVNEAAVAALQRCARRV